MPLIRSSAHTWIFFATLFVEVSLRSHWPYSGVIIQFPHVCWSRTRLKQQFLTLRHEEQNAMLLQSPPLPYLDLRYIFQQLLRGVHHMDLNKSFKIWMRILKQLMIVHHLKNVHTYQKTIVTLNFWLRFVSPSQSFIIWYKSLILVTYTLRSIRESCY